MIGVFIVKDGIKIEDLKDSWYIIAEKEGLYLLQNEIYGEDVPAVITNTDFKVILSNVYNGWLDYEEYLDNKYGKIVAKKFKLVFDTIPDGVNNLCAVVDRKCSLMKYGEEDLVKNYYMRLFKMYESIGKAEDLIYIDFSKLGLTLEHKYVLMNYMINTSANGEIVFKYLNSEKDIMLKWLDSLEEVYRVND